MGRRQDINNRMFLRPSPNEEKKLLQDEEQKLRKLRLQQVRQQEKVLASKARRKFKEKEKKEIDILETELKKKWEEDIKEKRNMLENKYYENVAHVGEGHQAALMCDDGAPRERSLEDEIRASERYRDAIRKSRQDDAEKAQTINEKTKAKIKAMEMERVRAARVAALEPPVPDIAQNLENIRKHRCKQFKNIDEYSSTYYHIPRERVERADPYLHEVEDAWHAAKEEEERLQLAKAESDRNFLEQMEKARLRHKHARSKLMLEKDHNKLLGELEHFERMDRQRRQEIVSQIPKHVFEPPHRRIEGNEERQREIEHAFENMYMAQTNYMGDITVAQDPLPVSPAATDEESFVEREERIKVDVQVQNREENGQNDTAVDSVSSVGEGKRKFIQEAEKSRTDSRPSSKDPLKRLLKKIDIQRGRWKSEMKTAKDIQERRTVTEVIIPDNESEISEGTLTMTTENARSLSAESDVANGKRTTLLHPHEEAERTRAASKYIQIPDDTRKIEIEKQKEQLQQQKLKLQLQQQQVMQEHLQLQFDALNDEMKENESGSRGYSTSDSHLQSPIIIVDKDTEFPDLSSGVLSDHDGKIESVNEGEKSSNNDVCSDLSHTPSDDSRVNANVDRHDALHSIPESASEDDFVLLPPVSTVETGSGGSQPLPLKFANTTASAPGLTKVIPTEIISPPRPVNSVQYTTGLFSGQPRLDSPSSEHWDTSLHISQPHFAIPAVSYSEEPIPSSQVPTSRLTHSVLQNTTLHTADSTKPPAANHYDNHEPSLKSKPPIDSKKPTHGVENTRAVIFDSTSPFFHMPSTISNAQFLNEAPSTFQFSGDRETDTASYLHFYQQQLLEQQNRIREQQKAIQERQQQRLEQLKQFQERLRGQRHDTGSGKSWQTGEKTCQSGGEWKSLIPSTRYSPDDNSSTSTDHTQSALESANRASSEIIHPDVTSLLKLPQLRTSTTSKAEISQDSVNDTSSSLSRYPSEVISMKDNNASLVPKTSDLGLWSDSTPHLSSSDATKSSLSALNEGKTDKKLEDVSSRPQVPHQFGISSSSLSNSSTEIAITSSERFSHKSGSSFDSGPLSTSSLPKPGDKNISTDSSTSDSNNNLLLQRMESSFQHFQEMIDEAKSLNEKYLSETRHSKSGDVEKRSSVENLKEKGVGKEGEEFGLNNQTNKTLLSNPEEDQGSSSIGDKSHEPVVLNLSIHSEDQRLSKSMQEPNGENFKFTQMNDFAFSEERSSISEENESRMYSSPMISNQENHGVRVQLSENGMYGEEHRPMSSYCDNSPKALSVIPEETRVSDDDDDLSEGVLEEEDRDFEIPNIAAFSEKQRKAPLTGMAQTNDYVTDIDSHGDDGIQDYEELRDFVGSESRTSFSLPNGEIQAMHTSPNYLRYHSPEQPTTTPHNSEELHKTHSDKIQYTPERQSQENLTPGGIITCAEASKKFGLHVDLPTTEKLPYNDYSTGSSSLSQNDVVLSGLSSPLLSKTDESSTSGLSLQDAFRKRRPEFFKHSQERILRAKEARYRDSPVKKKQDIYDNQHDSERMNHGTPEGTLAVALKPSSEKSVEKKSDSRQKIGKEEMKDRTKRLYENLPDVRQKVAEKQRQETYTANRLKAQEFQKQTRERLRKLSVKKTGKKM